MNDKLIFVPIEALYARLFSFNKTANNDSTEKCENHDSIVDSLKEALVKCLDTQDLPSYSIPSTVSLSKDCATKIFGERWISIYSKETESAQI